MDDLLARYTSLAPEASEAQIEKTAQDLERRNYMPPLILDVEDFYRLTKERMLREYHRVMSLPSESSELKAVVGIGDPEEVKKKHLTVLLNQYELLRGLRLGDGDAWATVNELYEDD
ncbi:hypothetical protein [Sphaerochaeta halotolerans]|jgi:hypothetical protein|uniref:hypothetical protein n=1 Tax=Sphaerochaeta halotolerans TaxID=2293840 RepID=UPI0013685335|nr:hypothetical protein [Sphaerochaeta halotolerans]MXI85365.1 hypothetical protein [Sphaerochaeta halotolerans]